MDVGPEPDTQRQADRLTRDRDGEHHEPQTQFAVADLVVDGDRRGGAVQGDTGGVERDAGDVAEGVAAANERSAWSLECRQVTRLGHGDLAGLGWHWRYHPLCDTTHSVAAAADPPDTSGQSTRA